MSLFLRLLELQTNEWAGSWRQSLVRSGAVLRTMRRGAARSQNAGEAVPGYAASLHNVGTRLPPMTLTDFAQAYEASQSP